MDKDQLISISFRSIDHFTVRISFHAITEFSKNNITIK
jgi:hypothetical protein